MLAFGGPFKGKTYVGTLATRALLRSGPPGIKALLEASHDLKKNALVQYGLAEMVPEESEALFSNTTGSERDRLIDELAAHTTDGLLAISKVGGAHALDIIAERIAADPDMICTTSQAVLVTLGKNRKSQTAALYVKGLRGSYTCEAMLRGFNDLTNQHFTSRADVERRWQANNATFK